MLPIQKAQFTAQCRSYFEIHEQLKKQLEQLVSNHNYEQAQFDFSHWVHQCCKHQYKLYQSALAQELNNTYETSSVLHPNAENQSSQVCLAKLDTNFESCERVDMDALVSNINCTKLKLEDFEEALAATLQEANASSSIDVYKTDGEDSDKLVVDTDDESDSNDKV